VSDGLPAIWPGIVLEPSVSFRNTKPVLAKVIAGSSPARARPVVSVTGVALSSVTSNVKVSLSPSTRTG
jgi:hypothetical protein